MNQKKRYKRNLRFFIILAAVFYAVTVLAALHYLKLSFESTRYGSIELLGLALGELLERPFAVFPLPRGTPGSLLTLTFVYLFICLAVYIYRASRRHYDPETVAGDDTFMDDFSSFQKEKKGDEGFTVALSEHIQITMDPDVWPNLNATVIGGPGSGKSFRILAPNILQALGDHRYGDTYTLKARLIRKLSGKIPSLERFLPKGNAPYIPSNYIITDPNGGSYKSYGGFLEAIGYTVKVFNLSHMELSNHYNPFRYIRSDKDVQVLVATIMENTTPPESRSNDPFWEKAEESLLIALVAYIYHYEREENQNFSYLMKLVRSGASEGSGGTGRSYLDRLFDQVAIRDPKGLALKNYRNIHLGNEKTIASVMISVASRLHAFDLADIEALTGSDDIGLDDIADRPTALFIITPIGIKTFNFLVALLYSQLFQRMYDYCENTAEYSQLLVDERGMVIKTYRAGNSAESVKKKAEAEAYLQSLKKATVTEDRRFGWWSVIAPDGSMVTHRKTKAMARQALAMIQNGAVIANSDDETLGFRNHGQRCPIHLQLFLDEFKNIGTIPNFPERLSTIRKYSMSAFVIVQSLDQLKVMYKDNWSEITGNCTFLIYLGGGADESTLKFMSEMAGKETRIFLATSINGRQGGGMSYNRQGVELLTLSQLRRMPMDKCVIIAQSTAVIYDDKFITMGHPNWNFSKQCQPYGYDEGKSEYLQIVETREGEKSKEPSPEFEKHGNPAQEKEEDRKKREAENRARRERAEEASKNRKPGGGKLFGDNRTGMTGKEVAEMISKKAEAVTGKSTSSSAGQSTPPALSRTGDAAVGSTGRPSDKDRQDAVDASASRTRSSFSHSAASSRFRRSTSPENADVTSSSAKQTLLAAFDLTDSSLLTFTDSSDWMADLRYALPPSDDGNT